MGGDLWRASFQNESRIGTSICPLDHEESDGVSFAICEGVDFVSERHGNYCPPEQAQGVSGRRENDCISEQCTHSLERAFEELQLEWERDLQEPHSSSEPSLEFVTSSARSFERELNDIQRQWELEFCEPNDLDRLRRENTLKEKEISKL